MCTCLDQEVAPILINACVHLVNYTHDLNSHCHDMITRCMLYAIIVVMPVLVWFAAAQCVQVDKH